MIIEIVLTRSMIVCTCLRVDVIDCNLKQMKMALDLETRNVENSSNAQWPHLPLKPEYMTSATKTAIIHFKYDESIWVEFNGIFVPIHYFNYMYWLQQLV